MSGVVSREEKSKPKRRRIEIAVKTDHQEYIKMLLINYFHYKNSPTYPVIVRFDGIMDYKTGEGYTKNFRIVEYDEEKDYSTELATIIINPYPNHIVTFIEPVNEDNESWEKIKNITKKIIAKMEELDYKVDIVKPEELVPDSLRPSWEQIPNHGADREILRLWYEGYENSEIGPMVGKDKETITNILSRLRVKHGEDIVPKKETIRRLLRGKKL